MGEARRIMVNANTSKAVTRKRPQKPLKSVTRGAENLVAIRALRDSGRLGASAAIPVVSTKNPTIVPAHPYAVKADECAADFSVVHASNDNDAAISPLTAAIRFAARNKVAMGVLAAITIGAVIGGTQMSTKSHEPTGSVSNSQLSPSLDAKRSLTQATHDTEKILPPNASSLAADVDPVAIGRDTTSQQANQYLDQVEQLRAQNVSLREEVDKLNVETTDLNAELLQLELALAEKEADARALVETRTVYNFVNVSSGNQVRDFSNDDNIDYSYNNDQQMQNEVYYDESEQYYEEPIPIEWDSNGQPIAFADAYSSEEPMEWDSNGQPVEFIDAYSGEAVLEQSTYSDYNNEEYYDPIDNVNYQGEQ